MPQRLDLVAVDHRRVVIERCPPALAVCGHRPHQCRVDPGQILQRLVLLRDVGLLIGLGRLLLGRLDLALVVEQVQKTSKRIGQHELKASKKPPQRTVGSQHLQVVHALPARGQQQHRGLHVSLGARSRAPLANPAHLLQRLSQPQRPHRLQHQRQPGVRCHRLVRFARFDLKRQDPWLLPPHRSPCAFGAIGCVLISARLISVSSSTISLRR